MADPWEKNWSEAEPEKASEPWAKDWSKQFAPGEPTFAEEVLQGVVDPITGAMQMLDIPKPAKAAPAKGKIPQAPVEGMSAGRFIGNVINPMNAGVAGGLRAATALGPVARSAITGGVSGFLQPVEEGENFWSTKAQQGAVGLGLGFGFSLGGKAAGAGISKLGEWLMGRYPDAIHNQAVGVVLDKIAKSRYGMTATDAIDVVRAANRGFTKSKDTRRMMTLSDLKDMNRLGGTVYRKSDVGRQMATDLYEARDPYAVNRLRAEIAKHIHSGDTMFATTEAMQEARSAAAGPAYEKLDGLHGIWSPRLEEFFYNPRIKEGLKRGWESERDRALGEGRPFNPRALGVDISDPDNIRFLGVPNMRMLDMAKRGLDAIIKDERVNGTLSSKGVDVDIIRKGYLGEIDRLDKGGVYKAAREAWGGPSRSLDNIKQGYEIFRDKPEKIAAYFSQLDQGEKEFYRIGVADAIIEKMMKAGASSDEARQLTNSNWAKSQIRAVFDNDKDYNKFIKSVTTESDMFNSMRKIAGGSDSAERLTADAQALGAVEPVIEIARKTFSGRLMGAAMDSFRLYRELGALKNQKELTDEIAKIIFQPLSPTAAKAHSVLEIRPMPGDVPRKVINEATPFMATGVGEAAPNQDMIGSGPEPL